MSNVQDIFRNHPRSGDTDTSFLSTTADELFDCSEACTACGDDCLGEEDMQALRRCIRMCIDCADVCMVTGRLVSRQTESDHGLVQSQLDACMVALRACAEECEHHASAYEHCRLCAEACRRCEQVCSEMRGRMAA